MFAASRVMRSVAPSATSPKKRAKRSMPSPALVHAAARWSMMRHAPNGHAGTSARRRYRETRGAKDGARAPEVRAGARRRLREEGAARAKHSP
jgi:hypothetical protein